MRYLLTILVLLCGSVVMADSPRHNYPNHPYKNSRSMDFHGYHSNYDYYHPPYYRYQPQPYYRPVPVYPRYVYPRYVYPQPRYVQPGVQLYFDRPGLGIQITPRR